jgi:hypothetical protein
MSKVFCAILALGCAATFALSTTAMEVKGEDVEMAEFSMATGYMLCPERNSLPPLEEAFYCSGVLDYTDSVVVKMPSQPVANPAWKLYSGTYTGTIEFENYKVNYELLISLTSADGKKYGFVDGRMTDNINKNTTYFRVAIDEGLDQLNYVTSYGTPIAYTYSGKKIMFMPQIVIAKKNAWKSDPLSKPGQTVRPRKI